MKTYEELQQRIRSRAATWLVTGAAGFIGSNLAEKLLEPRPERGRPGQLLHRQAREPRPKASASSRATSARSTTCREACRGRRPRAAPGGARQRAALDRRPARHARQQRQRLPQHAGRDARRRHPAPGVRQLERGVRRRPDAAQGRGAHRPRRLALRPVQAHQRALRRRVRALLRLRVDRPALLQRVRPAPGPRRRLRLGDPGVDRRAAARPDRLHQRRRQHGARLLPRRQRGAGEPAARR